MAQKVGSGYVEIEPRVSARDLKELQRKIQTFLESKPFNLKVDVRNTELTKLRTKINDFLSSRPIYLSLDVRASELAALRMKIQEALSLRPIYINIDVRARDIAAVRAKIEAGLSGINVGVSGGGGGGNGNGPNVPNLPDRDPDRGGGGRGRRRRSFGSAASGGFLSSIANAFQLSGPIGGTAIIVLAAALAAAAVPLGAMLGGLIFSAMGAIPLAGAILVAIQDPKVGKAFTDLKNKFLDSVVNPLKEDFGNTLKGIIDQFNTALDRWAPMIQSILKAGMSFAQPIANGVEGAIDIFLPGFDQLVNSDFMKDLMTRLGDGFKIIAEGFNDIFGDILNDPVAQQGFAMGLTDFFKAVRLGLNITFDFLRWLARGWVAANTPDEDGVTTVDRVKDLFVSIGGVLQVLGSTIFTKENIDNALDTLDNVFELIHGIIDNDIVKSILGGLSGGSTANTPEWLDTLITSFKQAFNPLSMFFDPEQRQRWSELLDQIKTDWNRLTEDLKSGWNSFTAWLSSSWETVKGWWNTFTEWLGQIWTDFTTWIHEQWTTFWAPFVTAWANIQTGWDNLIHGTFMGGWSNFDTWIEQQLKEFIDPFQVALDKIGAGWNNLVSSVRGIWDNFFSWLTGRANTVMAKVTKTPAVTNVAGKRFGGWISAATGGYLSGPGTGISDSIPAMVSDGEFVVNAQATSNNLGLLNAINNGQSYQPNISVYIDGVKVAHRAVVEEALGNVMSFVRAGRSD